jgi:LacI family transcriptional regulator
VNDKIDCAGGKIMSENSRSFSKITLKDISNKTGFTRNTVSRALKDKDDISPATRKLIQDVAKELGYVGNTLAGSLRSGLTRSIAVILPDVSNAHFGIMLKEIETYAREHRYTTFLINTLEDDVLEREAIVSAMSKNVDGIILCPVQRSMDNIRFMQKTGIPFVLLGRRFEEEDIDYVICDDVKGGYLATEHLLERGHNRILFLNAGIHLSSAKERLQGYKQALEERNIPFDPELVREVRYAPGPPQQIVRQMLTDGIPFTGIFAFNDMVAWEVIYMLQKMGYVIPKDFAVVGFDNIQARLLYAFPLTTISNSKGKMSRKAFEILMQRINSHDNTKTIMKVVDTKLVIREST